jgi:hypothetical protein
MNSPMLHSVPEQVLVEISRYISKNYEKGLPNSLLIAQAFMLKYPEYGKKYGLSEINVAVEYLINPDFSFNELVENQGKDQYYIYKHTQMTQSV